MTYEIGDYVVVHNMFFHGEVGYISLIRGSIIEVTLDMGNKNDWNEYTLIPRIFVASHEIERLVDVEDLL